MKERCEHCRNQHDRELPDCGAEEFVMSGEAIWWVGYEGTQGIDINFCPWCGRPLRGD